MTNNHITERYAKAKEEVSLGCANLQPFIEIRPGDTILDLGCGNGAHAASYCEQTGATGFVYGLDLTSEMIEKAKRIHNNPNLRFLCADMHKLPLQKSSVNIVLSNCVINHSTDKQKVFKEIYRVLKQGGYFLIGDVMAVEKLPEEISTNPLNIAACWGGAILKHEYLQIVAAAGFINVKELANRQYYKNNFLLESIILRGEKYESDHQG